MNEIRVTYSGLISLIFGIITIPVSLAFMLIITRSLSTLDYGAYTLILGIIMYAMIVEPVITYWLSREVARGVNSGRSAIFFGSGFSIFGIIIYLISAFILGQNTDAPQDVLLFGLIIIPPFFINKILTSINSGIKPHIPIITNFIFSLSCLTIAGITTTFFEFNLWVLIEIISISYLISCVVLWYHSKEYLKEKTNLRFIKKCIRLSWIPLFTSLGYFLLIIDITIFSLITGSVIGLAFWGVAIMISRVTDISSHITRAMYVNLLRGSQNEFNENLNLLFYFVVFFSTIILTFGKHALFLLNPEYEIATILLIILTIHTAISVFTGHFQSSINSIEKIDVNEDGTWKQYIHSKLISIPIIQLLHTVIYLTSLTLGLIIMKETNNFLEMLYFWAIISLITNIPFTLYYWIVLKKKSTFKIHHLRILKYFITGGITFVVTSLVTNEFLVMESNPLIFAPRLMLFMILGISMYVTLTYISDSKIRKLFKEIIQELKIFKQNK